MIKLSAIKLNPSNPRIIKDNKFKKLCKSIKDFPEMLAKRPIVCVTDTDGLIYPLGGNMRLKALQSEGYKEIPEEWILMADDWNEDQRKEFLIKDNIGYGEWDWEILANEWDAELLDEWGLDVVDFKLDKTDNVEHEEDDDIGEVATETDIEKGDIFEIGPHRLICGDSFSHKDVDLLMNGNKANIVFTDPPYDLESENYCDNLYEFTDNAHIFVMHDDKGIVNYLRKSKLEFSRFFVANFGFSSPRGNDPYLSHILISHEKKGKAIPHKNMHDGFRSIIPMEYRFRLKDEKTEHKHQKPISFINKFIEHYSNEGDIVLDLFGGSGTTLISSDLTNRTCYMSELDNKYCDLIIRRYIKHNPNANIKRNGIDETEKWLNKTN